MRLRKHPLLLSQPLTAAVPSAEQAGRAEGAAFFPVPVDAQPHKRGSPFPGGLLWKTSFPSSFEHLQYPPGVCVAGRNLSAFPQSGETGVRIFRLFALDYFCSMSSMI